MERTPVVSSNIVSIGYAEEAETLEMEFHNGSVYQYFNVPPPVYEALITAPSIGSFFHHNIKVQDYEYHKVQ